MSVTTTFVSSKMENTILTRSDMVIALQGRPSHVLGSLQYRDDEYVAREYRRAFPNSEEDVLENAVEEAAQAVSLLTEVEIMLDAILLAKGVTK